TITCLRTFAAKGHHCHGLTHLSWAERKIFTGFWVKNFVGCSFTLDSQCGGLWLSMPRRREANR
ncbi:hypothetical protein SE957_17745, partial [Escherichia coli]|nr:hypothetical protein [Escherichia coli]